jgi:uncharacterized repeat protein (TIGR03803 family)
VLHKRPFALHVISVGVIFGFLTLTASAFGQTLRTLHLFLGPPDGADPIAGLTFDSSGNLYGTTYYGGAVNEGTVFEMTSNGGAWTEKVLHSFRDSPNLGIRPKGGLVVDNAGNLYGTTFYGGPDNCGSIFELTPSGNSWTFKTLHGLNSRYACNPAASLMMDSVGNLYGTAEDGGPANAGAVFELVASTRTGKILYSFANNGKDGIGPSASLMMDPAGNLYGTTLYGGLGNVGTVFELIPNSNGTWAERVLFDFDGTNGASPYSSLVMDASGNLYGTTAAGGPDSSGCNGFGCGTVFELISNGNKWTEKMLVGFSGANGSYPEAGLTFDNSGNLYGTTTAGGTSNAGTIFELTPNGDGTWTDQVVFSFGLGNGEVPMAGLTLGPTGYLYGTTYDGNGSVFEWIP